VSTIERDGVKLGYEESGSGDPPLLLVHGWTGNRWFMHEQAAHFAADHRVVNVDLRGHGESDAPEQEYTIDGFADDLAWMIGELGLDHPIVVGHSMGGTVVVQLAASRGNLLGGIVLLDPTAIEPDPWGVEEGAFAHIQSDLNATRKAIFNRFFLPGHDASVREAVQEQAKLAPDHVALNSFGKSQQWDRKTTAQQVTVPTLHIAPEPGANQASTISRVIEHAVNRKIDDAGHMFPLEVPDRVNAVIEEFIHAHVPVS
jgi:pimeloyl-ACP methyl ester carboxylesterase